MTTTYTISYNDTQIVDVEIDDSDQAKTAIQEMVDFWTGSEHRLERAGGDYTKAWLTQLGTALCYSDLWELKNHEGWCLDGSNGIRLIGRVSRPEFDEDLVTIEAKS